MKDRTGASLAAEMAVAAEAELADVIASTTREIPFREFLEAKEFCGLRTSPAILAIAEASEGRPISTLDDRTISTLFACERWELPAEARRVVAVSAGGRGGKTSRMLAPKAVHAAWTVPLRAPGAPEDPRFPLAQEVAKGEHAIAAIVAPKRKLARKCFAMVRGLVEGSQVLRAALVGTPTKDTLTLRRPDGILVDISVAVADKGGASVRGGTLVFCGLDEASFFEGEDFAVNDEDIFSAAIQRVVPYGQVWIVSTPWIAEQGLLERFVESDWGSHVNALVVARVGTRTLNPTWDPDGSIERAERARPGGDENADREILAIPLPKGTSRFLDPIAIQEALERMPPDAAAESLGAGMDLGHINDNSGLAIAARHPAGIFTVPFVREILSSTEQKPTATYERFARDLLDHDHHEVVADTQAKANVIEILSKYGIAFIDRSGGTAPWKALKLILAERRLALGGLPARDKARLAAQMRSIIARPLPGGDIRITAPRVRAGEADATRGHADVLAALVLALYRAGAADQGAWRPVPPAIRYSDSESSGSSPGGLDYLRRHSPGASLRAGRVHYGSA